jgi:hypothetical protein
MIQVLSRSFAINCDGTPSIIGGPTLAEFGVRADLLYRRVWAGIAAIDWAGNTNARPSWRTAVEIQNDLGETTTFLDWWTRYGWPQSNFNINNVDDQALQFGPPFNLEKVLGGDPDKSTVASADARTLVFPSLTGNSGVQPSFRMTMFPMSITGRLSRIRMSFSDYADPTPGTCQLIGGLMIQSQSLPFT